MADKDYGCCANVTFTITVQSKGHWGKGATVDEVMRIGGRETISAVENALRAGGLTFKMVEKPTVGAITWGPIDG